MTPAARSAAARTAPVRARPHGPALRPQRLVVGPFRGDPAEWDRFVESDERGTFCHLWAWKEILEGALDARPLYLSAEDADGRLRGVLPLAEVRSRLTGHFLVSLPFLNDGGPLGDRRAQVLLLELALREARGRGVDLLEIRSRHPLPSTLRVSDRRITVLLPLPDDEQILWKERFDGKLRNQIRRPEKAGMENRFGPGEIDAFYHVFSRTMHDLGTPVLPRAFFDGIAERLPERVTFSTVYWKGEAVAAGCGLRHGNEFEITWAGFLREHAREAPNMMLYWGLMRRAIADGARVFNFGRCAPGEGTHRFKKQWGGEDTPLPWIQWSPGRVRATPGRESAALRAASAAWRQLPHEVANRFGPLLAKRLP